MEGKVSLALPENKKDSVPDEYGMHVSVSPVDGSNYTEYKVRILDSENVLGRLAEQRGTKFRMIIADALIEYRTNHLSELSK